MQALTNDQITHFRKRRRQFVLGGTMLAAVVAGVCLLLFQRDLEAAQLQQKWGLWRDEHCARQEGDLPGTQQRAYSTKQLAGIPGTWQCDDGTKHVLTDSDRPPVGWMAPASVD